MPTKVLDDERVKELVDAGHGVTAITRILKDEDGIDVSPSAICVWKKRQGVERQLPRHSALIPWVIREPHRRLFAAKMLRREAKRRLMEGQGQEMAQHLLAPLDRWKAKMAENDTVVHYEPETFEGFFYIERREGIDKDLIREPGSNE